MHSNTRYGDPYRNRRYVSTDGTMYDDCGREESPHKKVFPWDDDERLANRLGKARKKKRATKKLSSFDPYDQYVTEAIEDTTEEMWEFIGKELTNREVERGRYISTEHMSDHIADLSETFINDHCDGKPTPQSDGHSPYGSILDIKGCGQDVAEYDTFKCIYSANKSFRAGKTYYVRQDSGGQDCLYLKTDDGRNLYLYGEWADKYTKTFFAFKKGHPGQEELLKSVGVHDERSAGGMFTKSGTTMVNNNQTIKRKEENTMCLSNKSINRLNGLKVGEEKLVELTQESSERKVKTFDMVKLLQKTDAFKALKPGVDCLVEDIEFSGDKLKVTVLEGEVDREKTEAVLAALQEKLMGDD